MSTKPSTSSKGFQPESDVHITYDDQQKINRFARQNARLEEYKTELKEKKNDLKNMEDAFDEIELFDGDEIIPCLIGEVFVSNNLEHTQAFLQSEKKKIEQEIKDTEQKCESVQLVMNDLKTQLYQRFGNNISLESDE